MIVSGSKPHHAADAGRFEVPWEMPPANFIWQEKSVLALQYPCDIFRSAFRKGRGRTGLMNGKQRIVKPATAFAVGCFALCITVAATAPASAVELTEPQAALYSTVSIFPPDATRMTVCYGFVCRRREILDFTAADRAALTKILAAGKPSAVAERAAVQKAVIWFDHRMGPVIGTEKRVAKADFRYFDAPHNFDCWDTTRNTTSLLLVLQEWNLFKYHVVGDPHYRGNALVLQTPHNTAVLVDRATRIEWAVDLWPRGYLQPPDVMPITQWVTED
jgi:hypothetical protein